MHDHKLVLIVKEGDSFSLERQSHVKYFAWALTSRRTRTSDFVKQVTLEYRDWMSLLEKGDIMIILWSKKITKNFFEDGLGELV